MARTVQGNFVEETVTGTPGIGIITFGGKTDSSHIRFQDIKGVVT